MVDETSAVNALRATQVVYYVLSILEALLLIRFTFKLFAANTANNLVDFVYSLTNPFVAPFQGIFTAPTEAGAVFESATLLAMVVYVLIAYVVARMFFVVTEKTEI